MISVRALLVLACGLAPAVAHADHEADQLRKQGVAAAQRKDWKQARDLFQQAYAHDPRPLTLYNLAAAQEHTDQLLEARASYQKFLDETKAGTSDEFRVAALRALEKLEVAIPTLAVHVSGFAADIHFQLDQRELEPRELTAPIQLDPGTHTIAALHGTDSVASKQVELAAEGHAEVELKAAPIPQVPALPVRPQQPLPPPPPPPGHDHGVLASPWFWVIASAVVVGAAAGGGYYYHQTHATDPTPGTLGGTVTVP